MTLGHDGAVAASNARGDVRGYSPLQHALGRAPDLDGRFYTPENEAFSIRYKRNLWI